MCCSCHSLRDWRCKPLIFQACISVSRASPVHRVLLLYLTPSLSYPNGRPSSRRPQSNPTTTGCRRYLPLAPCDLAVGTACRSYRGAVLMHQLPANWWFLAVISTAIHCLIVLAAVGYGCRLLMRGMTWFAARLGLGQAQRAAAGHSQLPLVAMGVTCRSYRDFTLALLACRS